METQTINNSVPFRNKSTESILGLGKGNVQWWRRAVVTTPMEVRTPQPPSGTSSSSAAYPHWVTLERNCKINVDEPCCPTAAAAARTSTGHPIQFSLSFQEPPATSILLVNVPDGVHLTNCLIMAAHNDSLLVMVNMKQEYHRRLDYFVYNNTGDAVADPPQPPSLLLLPQYCASQCLYINYTGILNPCRSEDEVIVAELQMVEVSNDKEQRKVPELFLFRSGAWTVKRPRIGSGNDHEHGGLPSGWMPRSVFPVGDRILCWVVDDTFNNGGGLMMCDPLEENPCLQYVPLPSVPHRCFDRKVCGTAGGSMLKFVNIFPRCCCGGAGSSDCQHSHHAYTINTWRLRMDDGMEWVMDGMVDATELWSRDTYKGLPRVPLDFPIVSMYEPHVICFMLCERDHYEYGYGDQTLWLVMVDMRSKTIKSVSRQLDSFSARKLISINVSNYLSPYPIFSSDGTSTGHGQTGQMDIDNEKKEDDGTNYLMMRSPCKSSAEPAAQAYDEILAAFREIPTYGFASDDMLKVYEVLSSDNGHRVRSLLRLPKDLRKDWLLMEIKVVGA